MNPRQKVLLDLSAMPQQKLYLASAKTKWTDLEPIEVTPGRSGVPIDIPKSATFLCQVEWAWSPMNNSVADYYLSQDTTRTKWVLWSSLLNDHERPWRWYTIDSVQVLPRRGISKETAAMVLLTAYFEWQERAELLYRYHWINSDGLLGVGDIQRTADIAWNEFWAEDEDTD